MTMDPSEKDALLYVPGAGLTMMEQMGMSSKTDRFTRTDGTHLGTGNTPLPASMNEFERLEQYANLQKPPDVKFKDLEAAVNSTIKYNLLPMKTHVDLPAHDELVGAHCHHACSSSGRTCSSSEGQRVESVGEHLRPHHLDVAPRGQRVRGSGDRGSPDRSARRSHQGSLGVPEDRAPGARHVPAERGRQGHRRRQHEQLRDGAQRSALRRREAFARVR